MAWGRGNVELYKKDSKFESFLKRSFSDEAFERVRAYESCVISSEKESKAFKFIVLSDERLYLTENPPKTVEEAVHLKDVISVELVNEFPDFLRGKERTNTQHIAVTYWTSEPKRRSYRRSKKSPRSSLTDLNSERFGSSTPLGYANSIEGSLPDLGYLTQSSGSLPPSRPTSRGSIQTAVQTKKKKKSQGLNDSHDHESNLRSLKEVQEEDMMETIEEGRLPSSRSTATSRNRCPPANSMNQLQKDKNLLNQKKNIGTKTSESDVMSISSSTGRLQKVPPIIKTGDFRPSSKQNIMEKEKQEIISTKVENVNNTGCCFFFGFNRGTKNQITPSNSSSVINADAQPEQFKAKLLQNTNNAPSQTSGASIPSPSRASSNVRSSSRSSLLDPERNHSQLNTSFSDMGSSISFLGLHHLSVDGSLVENRKCVLNIYILNLTSPLLMLIKSAWNNYIIKSTLALEPEVIQVSTDPKVINATKSRSLAWREQVEHDFLQLKRSLFKTNLSVEELFEYIDQFQKATKSNILLKKLFWKQSDLFTFFITQLQQYLPHTKAELKTDEGKVQRADEIELSILILTTLNLMFRESEILPYRLNTVKLESGKFLTGLLKIVVSPPDFPYQPLNLTKHWTTPVHGSKVTKAHQNVDEELVRLKADFTKTAISTLFELIMLVKQAPSDELDIMSVPGLIAVCNHVNATEKFVDNLVGQIMELFTLSRFEMLSPTQSLLVFQMFTVLMTFIEENKSVVIHLRNNYYEEFKYFIQAQAVSKKLPSHYPLKGPSINLIESVVTKVLGNQIHISSKDFS
ncbi:uncharacterized protein C12orf56-like isoform X1 [Biomphalaria glabrata]|uniref:Uncharacterized protein C12orf56-like isoform X1 n=1 Tax=Biomphalaria glabrata TaxID=6526 RepID=A0A9U8DWS2_BIOGL|nr:uncharacterized protein C12orf56-like isoform X1 [Biomphalaria glabrata]